MQYHISGKDKEQQQYVSAAWRDEYYDTPHAFSKIQEYLVARYFARRCI
jgi:hypothetical protein